MIETDSPTSSYSSHAGLSKRRQQFFCEGTKPNDRINGIDLCGENHQFAESGKDGSNKMNGGHSEARLLADAMKGRTKNSAKKFLLLKLIGKILRAAMQYLAKTVTE